MTRLRIAVVGAGRLGGFHTRLLNSLPEVELVGVVDPLPASRQRASEEFGVETFTDHHQLQGKIDAAVIASPTNYHYGIASDLLNAGVHVLVEKPITQTVSEADRLIALAEKKSLVLQVGHVERFNPALRAAAKDLADPKYIEASRTSGYTFRSTDIGVVLDLMIHDIDIVLSLAHSEIVSVEAFGVAVFGPHEDMAQARLKFANGCVADLKASRTSFQARRAMQVYTARGYASLDYAAGEVKVVRPDKRLLRGEFDVHRLPAAEKERLKDHLFDELLVLEERPVEKQNAILEEQRDFVSSILDSREPRVSGRAGRDALAVAGRIVKKIVAYNWNGAEADLATAATEKSPLLQGPHWPAKTAENARIPSRYTASDLLREQRKAG